MTQVMCPPSPPSFDTFHTESDRVLTYVKNTFYTVYNRHLILYTCTVCDLYFSHVIYTFYTDIEYKMSSFHIGGEGGHLARVRSF